MCISDWCSVLCSSYLISRSYSRAPILRRARFYDPTGRCPDGEVSASSVPASSGLFERRLRQQRLDIRREGAPDLQMEALRAGPPQYDLGLVEHGPRTGTRGKGADRQVQRTTARQPDLEIGRAHVRTPVNNAHHVCRIQLEKK